MDCPADNTKSLKLNVTITCDADKTGALTQYLSDATMTHPDQCTSEIAYRHSKGCPVFTVGKFFAFMSQYVYIWGAALIVLGIFLAFFGNKFVNVMIYLVATLASFLAVSALFFSLFMHKVAKEWIQWMILGIIFVLANGLGFVCVKFRRWGLAFLAAWGGVMLGFALTTAVFISSHAAQWAIWIGFGALGFLFTFYTEKKAIIILTAFIGSYSLIRGISLYAGGFPNEIDLARQINSGMSFEQFPKAFYGYLSGIVVLWILAAWFQFKHEVEDKLYDHGHL